MAAEILLFPIRHHSPACAWHLERLIEERRPRAVLIEGPHDATRLIPHIAHPQTVAPVAIYTTFVDTKNALRLPRFDRINPPRFAAYYPLADFSPELVALRVGLAAGAEVRFIDLSFPAMVVAEGPEEREQAEQPARSLLEEHYFRHSRFLRALCEKTGARDPDDLWDHLYETGFQQVETADFMRQVETYCALSRADYTHEMLDAEGHLARERAMAAVVAEVAGQGDGLVLVVTGGFHTPGLRELLEQRETGHNHRGHGEHGGTVTEGDEQGATEMAPSPRRGEGWGEGRGRSQVAEAAGPQSVGEEVAEPPGEAHVWLMRYGFAQLDRLNGYSSGMPSPAFYQRVWEHLHPRGKGRAKQEADLQPAEAAASEFVVELGRLSRKDAPGLSPADEIAALSQARLLAGFRGHAQPAREDLLDGIRSAMVKGRAEGEGALLLREARRLLAGDRIGKLPPGAGAAPLVEDFRRTAGILRLDIKTLQPRDAVLDLYRRAQDRAASRFFYRLDYLGVPFARHMRGPDFVAGAELERTQEVWRYNWTPETESALTERSLYGGTLEEASAARLRESIGEAERRGLGRRAELAATNLLLACRMGLQRFAPELLAQTAALVAEDASFVSLLRSAESLLLLYISREPLEAHDIPGIVSVALEAYQRACYLLPDLAGIAPEEEAQVLDALNALPQVALSLVASLAPGRRRAAGDGQRETGYNHGGHGGHGGTDTEGDEQGATEMAPSPRRGEGWGEGQGVSLSGDVASENEDVEGQTDATGGANWNQATAIRELRVNGLRVLLRSEGNAALRGAAAGSLFADGALTEEELVGQAAGHMELHGPAFLRGLLYSNRAALWQVEGLLGRLNAIISRWPAERFIRLLPELRLAFSTLTAREADLAARAVATLLGLREAPSLRVAGASEHDLLLGAALNERVGAILKRDGLADSAQVEGAS